jgi:hypothetical protein
VQMAKALQTIPLEPYGMVRQRDSSSVSRATRIGIWVVHLLATIVAAVVIWQTIEIGWHRVLTWACWTSSYPVIWVGLALLHHLLPVGCIRASLRIRAGHLGMLSATPAGRSVRADHREVLSSFKYWDWEKMSSSGGEEREVRKAEQGCCGSGQQCELFVRHGSIHELDTRRVTHSYRKARYFQCYRCCGANCDGLVARRH